MSLSNKPKNAWQEHRDSLTRIRTQLSDTPTPVPRSPARSPRGGKVSGSHSPYGKYRQSTPPYLPRIDTPPEHDKRRRPSNLRGNRYEVVPPVRDARREESRNTDYDSWGEESDDDDDGPDPGHYMPQPYPYPMMGHPPPPQVVWGAPFPVPYYPPPPPQQNKSKKNRRRNENDYGNVDRDYPKHKSPGRKSDPGFGQSRPPLAERYEDVNRSVPSKNSKKKNRVHFTPPMMPPNGYYGYPGYHYPQQSFYEEAPRKHKKESKYKYIQSRDTPYSQAELHGPQTYQRFKDEPPGAESNPLVHIRDDIVDEVLPDLMHGLVKSTLNEMVDEYMLYSQTDKDPLESFLNRLLDDAVREATGDIVKETVKEMARDYVEVKHHEIVYDDVFNDFMLELGPELIEDAVTDMIAEDFIKEQVIEAELSEEIPEIAKEVLSHYDTKVLRRELKEVSSHAGDKLMESIMLDYLMTMMANQGKVWTESDFASKYLDDMLSSMLLGQLFDVNVQRRKTIANKPLRKLHEKVVTDTALEVLLQQLTASLDEDLFDVDEYERGITDTPSSHKSPTSLSY